MLKLFCSIELFNYADSFPYVDGPCNELYSLK